MTTTVHLPEAPGASLDDPAGQTVRASDVQRSFASATLRGVAADARHVLTRLRRQTRTADRALIRMASRPAAS